MTEREKKSLEDDGGWKVLPVRSIKVKQTTNKKARRRAMMVEPSGGQGLSLPVT